MGVQRPKNATYLRMANNQKPRCEEKARDTFTRHTQLRLPSLRPSPPLPLPVPPSDTCRESALPRAPLEHRAAAHAGAGHRPLMCGGSGSLAPRATHPACTRAKIAPICCLWRTPHTRRTGGGGSGRSRRGCRQSRRAAQRAPYAVDEGNRVQHALALSQLGRPPSF